MFGSSSTTPKVDLGRGYAAAVSSVTATPNKGTSAARTTVIAVGAAVALGVSALVGGSLLYSASQRTNDGSSDVPESKPAAELATTSWWRRALSCVGLRRSAEDDDDAFATGTGAASLFDAEKTKARQLSKGKATPAARAPVAAAAPARKAVKVSGFSEPKSEAQATIGYPSDIHEREQHIKLVRALLRREAGIEYSDDDDDDSSSSDETDVSLNYHFASTMEATARDELLMAFADFEDLSDGTIFGTLSQAEQAENAEQLQVNILVKILEYLDMSNEREKLRHRRLALYREQGRTTPASSADAADGEDEDDEDPINAMYRQLAAQYGSQQHRRGLGGHGDDEEEDEDEDFFPTAAGQQARQFQAMFGPSMMGVDSHAKDANDGDSILNRILGQAPASGAVGEQARSAQPRNHAAGHVAGEDMMEDEWEDEDDEERDFMAYLQQPDDAAHFYSREAMRQARRDPGHDVRVVGLDDDDDDEHEREWEDDEAGEEEVDEDEEGDDMPPAEPWSRSDKADFERELFSRIHQLANNYTLTAAVAEREADEEDARKLAERQQRRQEQQKAKAQPPVTAAASAIKPSAAVAEDEEDWEDEDEWEDEEEDA